MRMIETGLKKGVVNLSIGGIGNKLAIATRDGISIGPLHEESRIVFQISKLSDRCETLFLSRDGSRVIADLHNFTIFNLTTQPPAPEFYPGLTESHLPSSAITPDGRYLVASRGTIGSNELVCWEFDANHKTRQLWDIRAKRSDDATSQPGRMSFLSGHMFLAMCLSCDGTLMANTEFNMNLERSGMPSFVMVQIRNRADGSLRHEFQVNVEFMLEPRLQFSPSADLILVQHRQHVAFYRAANGQHVHSLKYPGRSNITGLRYHPNGQFFITVGGDRLVRYWDAKTFEVTKTLKWDIGKLTSVTISPDGTLAAAGDEKGKVILWDVDT